MEKLRHIRIAVRKTVFILILFCFFKSKGQTLGGASAFNFLKLPATPLLSAVGGVNTSYSANDVGLATNNPSLLNSNLHTQVNLAFNSFYAGINAYNLAGAYHSKNWNTTFGGAIFFIDYGVVPQTDAAGNVNGTFRPRDLVFQVSAAKKYLEKWSYGINAKFISSNYLLYSSSAIAFDIGVLYNDSSNHFSASVLAKNMGVQLKGYAGSKEDLPFDLQIGLTKRLAKAPFGFSLTLQQIHQFNILYNDTTFNNDNNFTSNNGFFNKFFNHVVFATHVYLGENLEATIGYNQLRGMELNIGSNGNGLNGFSAGLQAKFKKLQFQYARSYFQRGTAYNQFAVGINLNQLIGLGTL
ncbi:MAG: hypothetical protein C4330_01450 [Chitinophagaceae bacterium]